jgi:hypothetical protein
MGLIHESKTYGFYIRESANDGSDFSNPVADYRIVFLGEDGEWHSRDSAGTIAGFAGAGIASTIVAAKGDIIGASANDTPAITTVGANGLVLTADSAQATGLKWASSTGLLASVVNTAGGNKTTTSATQADVDATNAVITFTAPTSGNVIVRATVPCNMTAAAQNAFLGIRESTTNVIDSFFAMQGNATFSQEMLVPWVGRITGISAGSHTYKLAFAVNGGATFTARSFAGAPMTLEVWAAP